MGKVDLMMEWLVFALLANYEPLFLRISEAIIVAMSKLQAAKEADSPSPNSTDEAGTSGSPSPEASQPGMN